MPRAVVEPEAIVHEAVSYGVASNVASSHDVSRDAMEMPTAEILAIPTVAASPSPSALDAVLSVARRAGATAVAGLDSIRPLGDAVIAGLERVRPLGDEMARWLMRGAALVSMASVLLVIGLNRGGIVERWSGAVERWDRMTAIVAAARNRSAEVPPPTGPAKGSGRLRIASNAPAEVLVDGTSRGLIPMTIDLPAGSHRVVLKSDKGSVERSVTIQSGESSEINESIFSGWVALTAPIDMTISEGGHALKRDERGWAILAPGPHDIHLDNGVLGVHEARHVVITPGDTTRISFAPPTSTISLTTTEPAEIWIDGAAAGAAPLVDRPIPLGVHDIRVRSALHERWRRVTATVQPLEVQVDLGGQSTAQPDH
jgi:hypothetical protein